LGDQRAILEGFFNVLSSRGVHIASVDQGARLANAVADMVVALGGMQSFGADGADGSGMDQETHPLTSWVDAGIPAGADVS
jgi:hypothetical protein